MASQGDRHLTFWTDRLRGANRCYVYVIQGDPGNPIKVGKAVDVRARIATLQTGCWQELRLLHVLPGDGRLEWQLHRRLRGCRVSGEWFAGPKVPALLELVTDVADRMVAAYREGSGAAPDWHDFIEIISPPRGSAERNLVVRLVEPNPVDPDEAAARLAAHWCRADYRGVASVHAPRTD